MFYFKEWTIFDSDIAEAKEVHLGVLLSQNDEAYVRVMLRQTRAFSFSALLSVYLNEQWDAQSATAYLWISFLFDCMERWRGLQFFKSAV